MLLMTESGSPAENAKAELRVKMIASRRRRPVRQRSEAADANARHLADRLAGAPVVCGFLPLPSEPMSTGLLDLLADRGAAVLVPVVRADSPLDWCRYPGPTTAGPFGIAEPTGPLLGAEAIVGAAAILVPAFAVDRAGHRLGRGGGHYDRSLALLLPMSPPRIAVLFDSEIVPRVPVEPHDQGVTGAVTPTAGVEYFPS